jgi:hypothetical protein
VIDATGAIYVIGGLGGGYGFTLYEDVWASTDGGALLDSNTPVVPPPPPAPPPLTGGYSWSNQGVLSEYFMGTLGVLRGSIRVLRSTRGVLQEYSRG